MMRAGSNRIMLIWSCLMYLGMAPYLATAAGPLRGPRRMLHGTNAAVMANMPKYYIASRRAYYPLCTTQHDEGQVLSGNDAAIAAWRWNTEAGEEGASADFDTCRGTPSSAQQECWNGAYTAMGTYFEAIYCYTEPKCRQNPDGSMVCVGRR